MQIAKRGRAARGNTPPKWLRTGWQRWERGL